MAAPPNFGPSIRAGFITMYDVVEQVMIERHRLPPPWRRGHGRGRVSFTADILPLFLRLADMQWVNEGMYRYFGFGAPIDLADPAYLLRLADPSPANRAFRMRGSPRSAIPPTRDAALRDAADVRRCGRAPGGQPAPVARPARDPVREPAARARGRFVDDFDPRAGAQELADLPVGDQAAALDRAALEPVLGGPFHPGTEITWILRNA